jgi:hypothetical protein
MRVQGRDKGTWSGLWEDLFTFKTRDSLCTRYFTTLVLVARVYGAYRPELAFIHFVFTSVGG